MVNFLKVFGSSLAVAFGVFLISGLFSTQVHASEFESEEAEEILAEFDLTKNAVQEKTFINENGEEATIGIVPISSSDDLVGDSNSGGYGIMAINNNTYTLKYGTTTFKAYYYTAAINMSYRININRTTTSTKITSAYDLSILGVGYSISQNYWGRTSTRAAYEGTATLYGGYASLNVYLISTVSGSKLTIKAKA